MQICSYVEEIEKCNMLYYPHRNNNNIWKDIGWSACLEGCVKINVDGSVIAGGHRATCGGVFQDFMGIWLAGFSINPGSSSVLRAEMSAILAALELAWDKKLTKVCIESDSAVAVHLINIQKVTNHPFATYVRKISVWLNRDWQVSISHIHREANVVVDSLTTHGHNLSLGSRYLETTLDVCMIPLWADFVVLWFFLTVSKKSMSCLKPSLI